MNRYTPAAASLAVLVTLIVLLLPGPRSQALAAQEIMAPDGGRLDALDKEGNILGPCPLEHTDVDVHISGFLSRVTLTQTYRNAYSTKIEAVYTFPMSHRAAVDRMTMTIGDRVVAGEVKERQLARQIYEAAREQGFVASLLEQERPNIFTQSVANIEPGATVIVQISYVELLEAREGTYSFDFPMVVGPRYIPGAPTTSPALVPTELTLRHGLVLLGPARFTVGEPGNAKELGTLQTGKLNMLLTAAQPIATPSSAWWGEGEKALQPELWYRFEVAYCDGSKELGSLYTDGTGQLNARWFFTDPEKIKEMGTGFAPGTNQVPDASRITPEPVRPGTRAGHDISVRVTIDSGGPGLLDVKSELHEIVRRDEELSPTGLPRRTTLTLAKKTEIPNRDFVLSWRYVADTIEEATFVHTSAKEKIAEGGGFFSLILQPPARVDDAEVTARELVFVMDTSGSMRGFPIEKSKAVMTRAIDAMRPSDTFNVITFAGHTSILWEKPRPATPQNRAEAKAFVESRQGGGGTEMMKAINAALVQSVDGQPRPLGPEQLANLPADGRQVEVTIEYKRIETAPRADVAGWPYRIRVRDDLALGLRLMAELPTVLQPEGVTVVVRGQWRTRDGRRELVADSARLGGETKRAGAMRIVLFLTDGYVGNDMAIIDAVRKNAHTTRVFSFGIGNSVNRYLLDGMANAGRGEVEYVLLNSDADEAVARLTRRIQTPVLTDIELFFSDSLKVTDLLPGAGAGAIRDLFDAKPLVIHGRYTAPGKGTLTIRGMTGAGPYERVLELDLPESAPEHDVIATLWAREKVESLLNRDLRALQQGTFPAELTQQVIALGEDFQIMTQFTSFVAVERSRMTIGGKPMLVAVPIEMPEGVSYEGIFGGGELEEREKILLGVQLLPGYTPVRGLGSFRQYQSSGASAPAHFLHITGPLNARMRTAAAAPPPGGPKRRAPEVLLTKLLPGLPPPLQAVAGKARVAPGAGEAGWMLSVVNGRVAEFEPGVLPVGLLLAPDDETVEGLKDVAGTIIALWDASVENPESVPVLAQIPLSGEFFTTRQSTALHIAGRPIVAEHVAVAIAELSSEGDTEEAITLAEALAEARPDFEIGVAMRDLLADETLTETQREEGLAELAKQAKAQLEAVIGKARRAARLKRILHPVLLGLVKNPEQMVIAKGVTFRKTGALVSVLVSGTDAKTLAALRKAGLTVEDTAKSINLVVGTARVLDLEKLALLELVRRIEPTRMKEG